LRFRITNEGTVPVQVRPDVVNSDARWTARMRAADGVSPLAETVELAAGQSLDIVVSVAVPADARVTDYNTTRVNAVVLDARAAATTSVASRG